MTLLRVYQQNLVYEVNQLWLRQQLRLIVQSPTGSGKTYLIDHFAKNADGQVLIISHRREILEQIGALLALSDNDLGWIVSGQPYVPGKRVYLATSQTLINRSTPGLTPALTMIDECHRVPARQYSILMNRFNQGRRLGFSATPHRTDGNSFAPHFDEIIHGPEISDLINQGYLCSYRYLCNPTLKANSKPLSTYQEGIYRTPQEIIHMEPVQAWLTYAKYKRTLVFVPSVAKGRHWLKVYRRAGIQCTFIHGKSSRRSRERAIRDIKSGKLEVLISVDLFIEGVDIAEVECVQILRPTVSLITHLQMLGRGLRPCTAIGKTDCLFLDHTDNWVRLGLPDRHWLWSLTDEPPRPKPMVTASTSAASSLAIADESDSKPPHINTTATLELYSPDQDIEWALWYASLAMQARRENQDDNWIYHMLVRFNAPRHIMQRFYTDTANYLDSTNYLAIRK